MCFAGFACGVALVDAKMFNTLLCVEVLSRHRPLPPRGPDQLLRGASSPHPEFIKTPAKVRAHVHVLSGMLPLVVSGELLLVSSLLEAPFNVIGPQDKHVHRPGTRHTVNRLQNDDESENITAQVCAHVDCVGGHASSRCHRLS